MGVKLEITWTGWVLTDFEADGIRFSAACGKGD
jgi:hypothetical protein